MKRTSLIMGMTLMLVAALAGAAAATPAPADGANPEDGHKITICHATRSLSNPYVKITIDVAAWNDPDDPNHHGDNHTREKDGVVWTDYALEDPEDECTLIPPPPPPPTAVCGDADVNYVVDFNGTALKSTNPQTMTVSGLEIPAGTYEVILASADERNTTQVQDNEQWRALFDGGVASGYSTDLPGPPPSVVEQTESVGMVTLSSTVTSITAEHWSVAMTSNSLDSVIPVCVGLIVDESG